MSHAEVPDYLRTKPDPEVEGAEKQLISEVGVQADQLSMNVSDKMPSTYGILLGDHKNIYF